MAVLLLESEIKCLLATKSLQMSFTVSNRETIGLTVKAVKAGVCVHANTLIMSSLSSQYHAIHSRNLMAFRY